MRLWCLSGLALTLACTQADKLPHYDLRHHAALNDAGTTVGTEEAPPKTCTAEATQDPPSDLSGRWAFLELAARLAKAPAIADPIPNQTVTVILLDQSQRGSDLTIDGQYCDHWVRDPDAPVHTLIPDAYVRSLRPFTRSGSYIIDENGFGHYAMDALVEVRGAELQNPATDPLPTEPSDPRVVDYDGDGQPGLTVLLTGLISGELYVVDRRTSRGEGYIVAPDRIEGLLQFDATENILASDPTVIKDLSPTVVPDPEPCRSTIEMVRIADTATCDFIVQHLRDLFPGSIEATEPP